MKHYKIAVCFSGEPRTWKHCYKSALNFFKSDINEYVFFAHTWDSSYFSKDHKVHPENDYYESYDPIKLKSELSDAYNLKSVVVESKNIFKYGEEEDRELPYNYKRLCSSGEAGNLIKPHNWDQMSYSIMRSNELKTQYELDNFMNFDIVVKTRFDLCYDPNKNFDSVIKQYEPILPIALYCNTHYFSKEFFQVNVDDVFYFGSSGVMNIVDGFYRYYGNGTFWKIIESHFYDPAFKLGGYNINLYKWLTIKNILVKHFHIDHAIYRAITREKNLSCIEDYAEILKINCIA